MRYFEFLTEYKRDITIQKMGDMMIKNLAKSAAYALPDNMQAYHTLANMALFPQRYEAGKTILMDKIKMSPETAQAVLAQHKEAILDTLLSLIEAQDPTQNKEYTPWLVRSWVNADGKAKIEDMNRNGLIEMYAAAKRRKKIAPEYADINKFKTYKDFETTILAEYPNIEELAKVEKKGLEKGKAKEILDGETVRVIIPEDEAAACYYGQGTQWCTAATRGNNMFEYYNKAGPLYIILPKKPKYDGEKYQFHAPSMHFMDETDSAVNPMEIFKEFPELKTLLMQREPSLYGRVFSVPDDLLDWVAETIGNQYVMPAVYDKVSERGEDYQSDYSEALYYYAQENGYVDENGDVDYDKAMDEFPFTEYDEQSGNMINIAKEMVSDINGAQLRSESDELANQFTPIEDLVQIYVDSFTNGMDDYSRQRQYSNAVSALDNIIHRMYSRVTIHHGDLKATRGLQKVAEKDDWNIYMKQDQS